MRPIPLSEKLRRINRVKFSFGKNSKHSEDFAWECDACSMHTVGFGLGISTELSGENQLRGVFTRVMHLGGIFLFNISGVNLKRVNKGFANFDEAYDNNQVTEWELFMILSNRDYLKNCIFHNGKVQFKKRLLWKSIM